MREALGVRRGLEAGGIDALHGSGRRHRVPRGRWRHRDVGGGCGVAHARPPVFALEIALSLSGGFTAVTLFQFSTLA